MEQVLAPRFEFRPKNATSTPVPGFDYGEGGYDLAGNAMSASIRTPGSFGSRSRTSPSRRANAVRAFCREDLSEVIATFVQDRNAVERGLFDEELVPEEPMQVRMGKIIGREVPGTSRRKIRKPCGSTLSPH